LEEEEIAKIVPIKIKKKKPEPKKKPDSKTFKKKVEEVPVIPAKIGKLVNNN
jgi:hypothetical protein